MPNLNPFARKRADKERRRRQRIQIDLPVHVKAWRGGAFAVLEGRSSYLSEFGMAVVLNGTLQMGESVSVEMQLPGSKHPLMITAAVRDAKGNNYGFEFVRVSEEQRKAIVAFYAASSDKG